MSDHALSLFRELFRGQPGSSRVGVPAKVFAAGNLPDKELLVTSHAFQTFAKKIIAVKKVFRCMIGTLRPQCLYEHHLLLRPAVLILMLIFSCVVLATPLIVAASGGVSPPVGTFEGLLSAFGPQVSRLHSRQTLQVPQDCLPICEAFSTIVEVGTFTTSSPVELS